MCRFPAAACDTLHGLLDVPPCCLCGPDWGRWRAAFPASSALEWQELQRNEIAASRRQEGANNTVLQLDFLCWTTRDRFRVFRMKLSLVFPSWLASATLPKQLPACSTLSNKLTRIEEAA